MQCRFEYKLSDIAAQREENSLRDMVSVRQGELRRVTEKG